MHSKRTRFLAITLLIFSTLFLNVGALVHIPEIKTSKKSFGPNDKVAMSFIIKGDEEELIPESFKCEIKFDGDNLKYSKTNCSTNIKRSDIKVEKNSGFLTVIYSPCKQRKISFQNGKSKMFEIVFMVKNKVCSETSLVRADFKNLNSNEVICSSDSQINIKGNPETESCKLRSLTSECGTISPCFDMNILNYIMEVPSEIQYVDFNAVPLNENLSVKINRRKLAAPGKSTYIKITVSDKSLKIKSFYKIEVKRLPKGTKIRTKNNRSENDNEGRSKGDGKSKHKKSKELSKYDCTDTKEKQGQSDELENGNTDTKSASDTVDFENSPIKIYLTSAFLLTIATAAAYFIIRFIKSKKKLHEKPNNSVNNDSEK